ncbi:MAG: PAS domain S-box protein [Anaerolineales bacterium]|nr:PAS domain S-box protein [Anaerolineales bacterium]
MNVTMEHGPQLGSTVLLIDDEPGNLRVMADLLASHGIEVLSARDGEEGLARAQRVLPDLILLDVRLPGIDGFETCRRLKANETTREIPVIFMTIVTGPEKKVQGFEVGGVDYITKPFEPAEALVRVDKHLRLRNLQKQVEAQNLQLQQEIAGRKRIEEELRTHKDHLEELVAERIADLREITGELQQKIMEHKQAEEALRESEDRFRTLFANAPIGILVTAFDGRILAFNDTIKAMTNYLPQELEQRNVRELYEHPKDRLQVLDRFKTEGSVTGLELIAKRKDGVTFDVSLTVVPFTFNGEDVLLTALEDITERKQVETELRRLKEFDEGIVQNMAEGIVMTDTDGVFTFVNPATAMLLGYTCNELVGLNWMSITPSDQQPIVQAADERRMRGEADRYELELFHKDGGRITVIFAGSPHFDREGRFAGTIGVFTDITERKQAEEALRESEKRYRSLFERMLDGVYRSTHEGRFVNINPAMVKMFGY